MRDFAVEQRHKSLRVCRKLIGDVMIGFISNNFIICIVLTLEVLSFVIGIKLKNHNAKIISGYKKEFTDMTFVSRNKILFSSKIFKLCYLVTVIIFSTVIYCRLENLMIPLWNLLISILSSLLIAFAFIELILVISALLRRFISVNSILLNVMFSTVIIVLLLIYFNMKLVQSFGMAEFLLTLLSLSICYISMVVILIKVLKEANDENSRLTVGNIWKSAFLTIILFLIVLALMSMSCYIYDTESFTGANGGLIDMLYYTVITFATVGYGDVTPVSVVAKIISIFTVITYILCVTVLLSEIIGLKKEKAD